MARDGLCWRHCCACHRRIDRIGVSGERIVVLPDGVALFIAVDILRVRKKIQS